MLDLSPKSLLLKPISTALLGQELSPLQAKRPEAKPRARGNAPRSSSARTRWTEGCYRPASSAPGN